VVDCIDNLDAKVEVVRLCKERGIRLICSGGAGMKSDPTRLQIRDISECKYDCLIMRLRRELVKHNIKSGVKVAFSYQQAEKELLPLEKHQEDKPDSYRVFDNYRLRIVPVLGTMPAILGMAIASYVLCDLAGEPYSPHETDYVKSSAINKLYNELMADERKRGVAAKDLVVDMEEVSILAKEVFKWKSVVSERKESSQRLGRWDPTKPATIDNLALFGKEEYEKHLKLTSLEEANYSEEVR
jgi:tRNA threonylcarbamoyladenosine dehydratase